MEERHPRGNTYSMKKIGLLVPYYVKDALSDRKLRWTPSSSFITYHLYYHYFFYSDIFTKAYLWEKEKINTFLKLLIPSFYEVGLCHKLKFKEKKVPAS